MKVKRLFAVGLFSLLATVLVSGMFPKVASSAEQRGPAVDMVRVKTVNPPDAAFLAMQNEMTHFLPGSSLDMIRPGKIEALDSDGFTIVPSPGFHMGHIGFNIRADQSYRNDRPASQLPYLAAVLSDVNFRHAVLHAYDQDAILAELYKYIVTKSTSLVPPAQGGWLSPTIQQHPYNPGDPFATTVWDLATGANEDSCAILRYGGYTFVDADASGTPTKADYWEKSGFSGSIPMINLFTPTYEVAPTAAEHGARLRASLNSIGLNNIVQYNCEYPHYILKVFQNAEFDMYMRFYNLDRFPDHLYDMLHSSQDCVLHPWRLNAPGVNDPHVDARVETVKFGLNQAAMMAAAHEVQDWLSNAHDNPQALPYIQLYSRTYFTAGNPDFRGIVKSLGYGADNRWSWLNWRWAAGQERTDDGKTIVVYSNGDEPERLNPTYASTAATWNVLNPLLDGLLAMNPYTHEDVPWLADSWTVTPTATGMELVFTLNSTVTWQDGNAYTAEDAEFNLEFLRDNAIPRYTSTWQNIVDVQVVTSGAGGTIKVILDEPSQFLLYDVVGVAALLPPPVWAPLDGQPLATILGYDPTANTTKPTGAGPRFGQADGPSTQLYGTGPYVFQFYDAVEQYADLYANRHYFKDWAEIARALTEMFYAVGDVNRDGVIDIHDLTRIGLSFGYFHGEPEYDADADVNWDGIIDTRDVAMLCGRWGQRKEYP